MLARIVENWLTNAGELGYQAAFAQLLAHEGHRVLHAPVHHPYEHGKDLVTIAQSSDLHAYQLKGGDVGLSELETIQGQLFALAATAVTYPGIEPPRRPDRVFLVTNGRLSAPARDRVRSLNDADRVAGIPPIEVLERDQLVGRFVQAHEGYLPSDPKDLNQFLAFVLADGSGMFPVDAYAPFLAELMDRERSRSTPTAAMRALSSAVMFTAYASGPWQRKENHLAVAEAWLTIAVAIVCHAEALDLADEYWRLSFELSRDSARAALRRLLDEASAREDLSVPHVADGLIYSTRAALVCGYSSALYLMERELENEAEIRAAVDTLLDRELPHAKGTGEAGVPLLLVAAAALEMLGKPVEAGRTVYQLARSLATANQPGSHGTVADPYHRMTEVLLQTVGGDTAISDEDFAGDAYTLHVLIEWLARRDLRPLLNTFWADVTRIHFCEFRPSRRERLLSHEDADGELKTWAMPMPTRWAELRRDAGRLRESDLPVRLWQDLYLIALLPLLYPYRLTSGVGKALDYLSTQRCEVELDPAATTR